MVIFNSSGEPAGRMVGRADIQTTDSVLARVWNDEVKPLPCPATPWDDPAWVQRVYAILAKHGYRGRRWKEGISEKVVGMRIRHQ